MNMISQYPDKTTKGATKVTASNAAFLSREPTINGSQEEQLILPEILVYYIIPPTRMRYRHIFPGLDVGHAGQIQQLLSLKVCALETEGISHRYPEEVKYVLPSSDLFAYENLATRLNLDDNLDLIFIQHEFGLFSGDYGQYLLGLLCLLTKPVITTFHTILPAPDAMRKKIVRTIAENSVSVITMTVNAARILNRIMRSPLRK